MRIYAIKKSTPRSAARAERSNDIEHKGNAQRKARLDPTQPKASPIDKKIIRVNGKPRG